MSKNKFLFKNIGLRTAALVLAIVIWAIITGKERSYVERTIDVKVDYFGVANNIDIRDVSPEKVMVQFRASSRQLNRIQPDDFKLRIDLSRVTEGGRIVKFTEDLLDFPDGVEIMSISPKLIDITATELITMDIAVRIRYKGRLKQGIRLIDRRVIPEKVKIFGYKSQVSTISSLEGAEPINLSNIETNQVFRIPLKKDKAILKFEDTDTVEVHITVENSNKPNKTKKDEQTPPPQNIKQDKKSKDDE